MLIHFQALRSVDHEQTGGPPSCQTGGRTLSQRNRLALASPQWTDRAKHWEANKIKYISPKTCDKTTRSRPGISVSNQGFQAALQNLKAVCQKHARHRKAVVQWSRNVGRAANASFRARMFCSMAVTLKAGPKSYNQLPMHLQWIQEVVVGPKEDTMQEEWHVSTVRGP